MKRALSCLLIIFSLIFLCTTCGIDEYAYLYPIPQEKIITSLDLITTVDIPNDNSGTVFTNFIILYRIYISDVQNFNPLTSDYANINSVLATHFRSIDVYNPSSDRVFSASLLESLFRNRGYKYLRFENADLESVLTDNVLNSRLIFDFTYNNRPPKMTVMKGAPPYAEYTMKRSDELIEPEPQDNLFFVNTVELYNPDLAVASVNADVEKNSRTSDNNIFTYAAMFIIAVGIDTSSYSLIYSNPTLIHAFPLPNRL